MLIELLVLLVSVLFLARSSSLVVDSAIKLSNFFRISQLTIGIILLAMATSLPELSVSVISSVSGEGAIAAGNVFGSNISNILLILGLGAFIYGLKVSASNLRDIGFVLLLTTVISAYIIFNSTIQQRALGFIEGAVLLAIFLLYSWRILERKKLDSDHNQIEVKKAEALRAFLLFCLGIVVVMVSSSFVVESAVALAELAGLAKSFIGATIIAIGTSLPELTVDLQALRRRQYGLALGDAIGSNMVNLTLVLGTAAVLNPIHITLAVFIAALLFAVIANSLLFYVAVVKRKLRKLCGAAFLALYIVYLALIFTLQFRELGA